MDTDWGVVHSVMMVVTMGIAEVIKGHMQKEKAEDFRCNLGRSLHLLCGRRPHDDRETMIRLVRKDSVWHIYGRMPSTNRTVAKHFILCEYLTVFRMFFKLGIKMRRKTIWSEYKGLIKYRI